MLEQRPGRYDIHVLDGQPDIEPLRDTDSWIITSLTEGTGGYQYFGTVYLRAVDPTARFGLLERIHQASAHHQASHFWYKNDMGLQVCATILAGRAMDDMQNSGVSLRLYLASPDPMIANE